jgi:hypothetical protein
MAALPPHQLFDLSLIENLYFFGNGSLSFLDYSQNLQYIKNEGFDTMLLLDKIFRCESYIFRFYGFPVSMASQLYGLFSNIFA